MKQYFVDVYGGTASIRGNRDGSFTLKVSDAHGRPFYGKCYSSYIGARRALGKLGDGWCEKLPEIAWTIVDDETRAKSEVFETRLPEMTKAEALAAARDAWGRKTISERRACTEFYLCKAPLDEDGRSAFIAGATDFVFIKERD